MAKRIHVDHPLLEKLRKFANDVEPKYQSHFRPGLGTVGLTIHWPLKPRYYAWCTPFNAWVFADTGMDGHHFSLLERNGIISANSPVILTMPDNCGFSRIVGANLHEFLCLGCLNGYSHCNSLWDTESAAHLAFFDPHWRPTTHLEEYEFGISDDVREILGLMRFHFDLLPWSEASRLAELQQLYESELQLPREVTGE